MSLIHANSSHRVKAVYHADSDYRVWGSLNKDRIMFPGMTRVEVRDWNLDTNGNGELVLWIHTTDPKAVEIVSQYGEDPTGTHLQYYPLVLVKDDNVTGYGWIQHAWVKTGLPLMSHQVELHVQVARFQNVSEFPFARDTYGNVDTPQLTDLYIGTQSGREDSDEITQVTIPETDISEDKVLYASTPVTEYFPLTVLRNLFVGALYDRDNMLLRPAQQYVTAEAENFEIQDELMSGTITFPDVHTTPFYVDSIAVLTQNTVQIVLRRDVV